MNLNKPFVCIILVLAIILALAGTAASQCEGEGEGEGGVDFSGAGVSFTMPVVLPPQPRPPVDNSWSPFNGLDRQFVSLAPGQSVIVNLTVPEELGPYTVSWISQDTSIATVVANSPARITARGVGETWVLAVVKTDTATHYSSVKVAVVSEQVASAKISGAATPTAPAATPSTGGGLSATLVSVIALTAALPLLLRARKKD
jgi:hypothetical protein